MAWFKKERKPLRASDKRDLPGDVFEKCPSCGEILYREKLSQNLEGCPSCGFHFRITAERYVDVLLDEGSFEQMDGGLRSTDPLGFTDLKRYPDRIAAAERAVPTGEAVLTGHGRIEGLPVHLGVMDYRFIGGSMGSVVGEKLARCGRGALERKTPLIIV